MVLITFQHSIKYIYVQLAPYLLLTSIAAFLAYPFHIPWALTYVLLSTVLAWRYLSLSSTMYFFTHDMLIISKGIIIKQIDCRSLWQLKGFEVRSNRLLRLMHVSHIQCGLQGPPADRIRITGVDNQTMIRILEQLKDGIDTNLEEWRKHFLSVVA